VERDEGKRGIKGVIATLIRETRVERVGVHVGQVHVTAWRVLGKRLGKSHRDTRIGDTRDL